MSLADEVREYCRATYVQPARSRGERTVTIRSGDVHSALGYANRHPLVCSALGTQAFHDLCAVERVSVDGPLNSSNTYFTFRLL